MKKIVCEICGSSNIVKKDGVFICQDCGLKYTADEAKKLLVEVGETKKGKSIPESKSAKQISSSVSQVNASQTQSNSFASQSNSAKLQTITSTLETIASKLENRVSEPTTIRKLRSASYVNNLNNARRAKAAGEWSEAVKYYNRLESADSHDFEAVFYSVYCRTMAAFYSTQKIKRPELLNVLASNIRIIAKNYDISESSEMQELFSRMSNDLAKLVSLRPMQNLSRNIKRHNYRDSIIESNINDGFAQCEVSFVDALVQIYAKDKQIVYAKLLVKHCDRCLDNYYVKPDVKAIMNTRIEDTLRFIWQFDPNYYEGWKPKRTTNPSLFELLGCGNVLVLSIIGIILLVLFVWGGVALYEASLRSGARI
ncbi:MAG: hypothetical protein Q4F00_01085 [bacterium]|nr:hypothetical protein [bacterium]